jgi:hypothetical protein
MGRMRNLCKMLVEKYEGKRPLEDLGVDGRIMLDCILGKQCGKLWIGCIWLRIVSTGPGSCEHSNEPSSSMKSGIFLH